MNNCPHCKEDTSRQHIRWQNSQHCENCYADLEDCTKECQKCGSVEFVVIEIAGMNGSFELSESCKKCCWPTKHPFPLV